MNNREIKFRAWNGKKMNYEPLVSTYDASVNSEFYFSYSGQSNLEFMQYTGLKDKNGKEIYEGDVVKWTVNDVDRISEVIFDSGCFWMNKVWNDWLRGEYEVIGNIYENP